MVYLGMKKKYLCLKLFPCSMNTTVTTPFLIVKPLSQMLLRRHPPNNCVIEYPISFRWWGSRSWQSNRNRTFKNEQDEPTNDFIGTVVAYAFPSPSRWTIFFIDSIDRINLVMSKTDIFFTSSHPSPRGIFLFVQ